MHGVKENERDKCPNVVPVVIQINKTHISRCWAHMWNKGSWTAKNKLITSEGKIATVGREEPYNVLEVLHNSLSKEKNKTIQGLWYRENKNVNKSIEWTWWNLWELSLCAMWYTTIQRHPDNLKGTLGSKILIKIYQKCKQLWQYMIGKMLNRSGKKEGWMRPK